MSDKTSTEIQEIFGLGRDDVKRLEKEGVLKPKKNGQGKASIYGDDDLNRLLGIKIYLMGGYRIADMKSIITDSYDSSKSIAEQIHMYKKRIQVLEYIQNIDTDINRLVTLMIEKNDMAEDLQKVSDDISKISVYNSKEYRELFWDMIKLVFIIDFLSRKESLDEDKGIAMDRALSAYKIVVKLLDLSGAEISKEEIKNELIDIVNAPEGDDQELMEYVRELKDEYLSSKGKIMEEFTNETYDQISEMMGEQSANLVKEMINHTIQFILDYFVDEEELYCIFKNFHRFVNGLDQKALAEGEIRLVGKQQ